MRSNNFIKANLNKNILDLCHEELMDGNFFGDILVKLHINNNYENNLTTYMKSSNMENSNVSCEQACQNGSPCVGWVYHNQNQTCNLFNKLNQLYEFSGTYFGIKNCTTQLFNQLVLGIPGTFLKTIL